MNVLETFRTRADTRRSVALKSFVSAPIQRVRHSMEEINQFIIRCVVFI